MPMSLYIVFLLSKSLSDEMDELLMHCFLCALKKRLKEKELPITTVNFYRNHMKAFWLVFCFFLFFPLNLFGKYWRIRYIRF